jgi:large subunit ribosomal protein L4
MPKLDVYDQSGKKVSQLTLKDEVFGIEPNEQALYDVVKAQRAAMRQGTHKVKNRSEVSGGGRKPWRQKGTGRARQGSIRSPQWRGGGVVFGPTPRDYYIKVNRKVRRLALRSALSLKVTEKALTVLDAFALESAKTKSMVEILSNLKLEGKTLIIMDAVDSNVLLSARNIEGVEVTTSEQASVFEIMSAKNLLVTQSAANLFEEALQ